MPDYVRWWNMFAITKFWTKQLLLQPSFFIYTFFAKNLNIKAGYVTNKLWNYKT